MNKKGIVIDFIILAILAFLLMIGIYTIYEVYPKLSRLVAMLVIFFMIPIFWVTIIFSIMGKGTIGNKIMKKKKSIAK